MDSGNKTKVLMAITGGDWSVKLRRSMSRVMFYL